jgi:hypothetical protein
MFGYNPTVNDRSGELQAAGNLAGAQGIASGIQSAGQSIGAGLFGMAADQTKATEKAKVTQDELDMMNGSMAFMQQQGAVDGAMLEKFNSGSIGAKRGIYNMGTLNLANMMKQSNIQMMQAGQGSAGGAAATRGLTSF